MPFLSPSQQRQSTRGAEGSSGKLLSKTEVEMVDFKNVVSLFRDGGMLCAVAGTYERSKHVHGLSQHEGQDAGGV